MNCAIVDDTIHTGSDLPFEIRVFQNCNLVLGDQFIHCQHDHPKKVCRRNTIHSKSHKATLRPRSIRPFVWFFFNRL